MFSLGDLLVKPGGDEMGLFRFFIKERALENGDVEYTYLLYDILNAEEQHLETIVFDPLSPYQSRKSVVNEKFKAGAEYRCLQSSRSGVMIAQYANLTLLKSLIDDEYFCTFDHFLVSNDVQFTPLKAGEATDKPPKLKRSRAITKEDLDEYTREVYKRDRDGFELTPVRPKSAKKLFSEEDD